MQVVLGLQSNEENISSLLYLRSILESSGSQQVGRDPLLGRVHLLLGRQNLCFSTILVICGSPN